MLFKNVPELSRSSPGNPENIVTVHTYDQRQIPRMRTGFSRTMMTPAWLEGRTRTSYVLYVSTGSRMPDSSAGTYTT